MKQRAEKKYKAKVDSHSNRLADMEKRLHREKIESRVIGLVLVIGVPLLNWFALLTKAEFINARIGPIDIILIIVGFRFLLKGK